MFQEVTQSIFREEPMPSMPSTSAAIGSAFAAGRLVNKADKIRKIKPAGKSGGKSAARQLIKLTLNPRMAPETVALFEQLAASENRSSLSGLCAHLITRLMEIYLDDSNLLADLGFIVRRKCFRPAEVGGGAKESVVLTPMGLHGFAGIDIAQPPPDGGGLTAEKV